MCIYIHEKKSYGKNANLIGQRVRKVTIFKYIFDFSILFVYIDMHINIIIRLSKRSNKIY